MEEIGMEEITIGELPVQERVGRRFQVLALAFGSYAGKATAAIVL